MPLARCFIFASVLILTHSLTLEQGFAGDWPQILGAQRNGTADNETLEKLWTAPQGPKVVWEMPVGSGLAGVAVAKGTSYVFHREADRERLDAVNALTGKQIWSANWTTDYQDTIAGDDGPRCVPLVQGDFVYALGAAGTLACLRTQDGKLVWKKNIAETYEAQKGYFGVGSTPILDSGVLIVNVGGQSSGAGIVGFNPETGEELWKSVADAASYSAPVATTIDGTRHLLCITRLKLVSLDPKTGKVRFEFPFGKRGPTVNGANPLVIQGHVLVTASYGIGATLAKIGKSNTEIVWGDDEILSSQYATPVESGGNLYAVEGREDQGRASIRCFEPFKKKLLWEQEDFGIATPILVGDKILLVKSDGTLVVIKVNPKKFEPLAEAKLFNGTTRALPAFSNGMLYLRDTSTLKCFNLRP